MSTRTRARIRARIQLDPARRVAAVLLATSGWLHAELYVHGYRVIPWIGPLFRLQAAGSFAVAVLLLVSGSVVLRLGAFGLAGGALAGFALSRTVGVFGFVERGFDPAPQALLSVLAEVAVLALLAGPAIRLVRSGSVRLSRPGSAGWPDRAGSAARSSAPRRPGPGRGTGGTAG